MPGSQPASRLVFIFRVEQIESKLPVAHTPESKLPAAHTSESDEEESAWSDSSRMRSDHNQKVICNDLNKHTMKLTPTHIPENTSTNQFTSETLQNHKSHNRQTSVRIRDFSKNMILITDKN
jgi:hypothetical protein